MSSDPTETFTSGEEERTQHEEQLNLLQTITMEVAAANDLTSALEVVLREVCEKTGWVLGHAWIPNPDSDYRGRLEFGRQPGGGPGNG